MAVTNSSSTGNAEPAFEIIRMFDAPRELVFAAWTQHEHLVRWWGVGDFTMPYFTIDFRVGGAMRHCWESPEGFKIWCKNVFTEIDAPRRIVSTVSFTDEHGNTVPPTQYGLMPEWPLETVQTVTFEEVERKTRLTVNIGVSEALAQGQMADRGWAEVLNRLAEHVQNRQVDATG